jgi:hypothetical protein
VRSGHWLAIGLSPLAVWTLYCGVLARRLQRRLVDHWRIGRLGEHAASCAVNVWPVGHRDCSCGAWGRK